MSNTDSPDQITVEALVEILSTRRVVTHEQAAKSQLEQAIFLWFHKDDSQIVSDPTSIHTLAMAVEGILWEYAHDSRQQPSKLTQTVEKLDAPERANIRDSQNFFKHGNTGRTTERGKRKAVPHLAHITDLFLADCCGTFTRLFMRSSALIDMYLFRYSLEHPKSGIVMKALQVKLIRSGYALDAVAKLDRNSFYEFVSPYAVATLREERAPGK
jgi:hypothetical protein